jgi:hypothetical protein
MKVKNRFWLPEEFLLMGEGLESAQMQCEMIVFFH